jgi:uncharacterized protein
MSDNEAAFWKAVKTGDAAGVQAFLAAEPALAHSKTAEGVSAVLLAVYYGHAAVGELLLAARGQADAYEAAALGHTARVSELLEAEAALVNTLAAADGFSLLGLAAYFGHADTVGALLARGADPNLAAGNSMQVRPLHSAVAHHDAAVALSVAETLVRHGAELNAVQEGGYTALHETANRGDMPLTELLLSHGADPSVKTSAGQSPLDLAEQKGHNAVAARLRAA